MRCSSLLLLAAAALSAATGFSPSDATPSRSVAQLKPCRRASAKVPVAWQSVTPSQTHVAFRLAPRMTKVDQPKNVWCIHGCQQWARGTFSVSMSYGMWTPDSFAEDEWAAACVSHRKDVDVVEMDTSMPGLHDVVAWPIELQSRDSGNGVVISVKWSDDADTPDAHAVLDSIRVQ